MKRPASYLPWAQSLFSPSPHRATGGQEAEAGGAEAWGKGAELGAQSRAGEAPGDE